MAFPFDIYIQFCKKKKSSKIIFKQLHSIILIFIASSANTMDMVYASEHSGLL